VSTLVEYKNLYTHNERSVTRVILQID